MHEIVCRLGFAPDPTVGAYSAPPDPYLYLGGILLEGGERRGRERGEGEGRGGGGLRKR